MKNLPVVGFIYYRNLLLIKALFLFESKIKSEVKVKRIKSKVRIKRIKRKSLKIKILVKKENFKWN